jgi:hypothetical protein
MYLKGFTSSTLNKGTKKSGYKKPTRHQWDRQEVHATLSHL